MEEERERKKMEREREREREGEREIEEERERKMERERERFKKRDREGLMQTNQMRCIGPACLFLFFSQNGLIPRVHTSRDIVCILLFIRSL